MKLLPLLFIVLMGCNTPSPHHGKVLHDDRLHEKEDWNGFMDEWMGTLEAEDWVVKAIDDKAEQIVLNQARKYIPHGAVGSGFLASIIFAIRERVKRKNGGKDEQSTRC